MKPTKKSPVIEAFMQLFTGVSREELVRSRKCMPIPIGCGEDATKWHNAKSIQEYTISGLCQKCQDRIFGVDGYRAKFDVELLATDFCDLDAPDKLEGPTDVKYKKILGKSGRMWVYPNHNFDASSKIHVSAAPHENAPGFKGFRGYGGSWLTFQMEDGTELKMQGPWNSNPDALFKDTGIDLRDTSYTYVVIGKTRKSIYPMTVIGGVLYRDEQWTAGRYDRYRGIVKEWANKLKEPVAYYMMHMSGGSSSGLESPDEEEISNG